MTHDQQALSIDFPQTDSVFSGFKAGDFTVLCGHEFCRTLLFILAVRVQLPIEKGGLNSTAIYADGGNSFNPYVISSIAKQYELDPRSTLERIFVSRAFTAYQLSTLISETLEDALKQYQSKLVLVSDITAHFLDRDVPSREAIGVFNKTISCLSELAKQKDIIIVASCFPHEKRHRRRFFLEPILLGGASSVLHLNEFKEKPQRTFPSCQELQQFTANVQIDPSHFEKVLKE